MARTDPVLRRHLSACAAGMLLSASSLQALASPAYETGEYGFLSVTVMAAQSGFGLDYSKRTAGGPATAKLQDGFELGGATALPWYAAGLRLTERITLGAEYLAFASNSAGEARKRVKFGPFRFFVAAPTDYVYFSEVARGWLSCDLMQEGRLGVALFAGLSAMRLRLSANADGLGGKSEKGAVAMPTLGMRLRYGDLGAWRLVLSMDYSHAGLRGAVGRAFDAALLAERSWTHGIVAGAGYRHYKMQFDAERESYEAHLNGSFKGPFVSLRWAF